jgi:3,4-dihydroxy-2-butanone 4-phosphate synthase
MERHGKLMPLMLAMFSAALAGTWGLSQAVSQEANQGESVRPAFSQALPRMDGGHLELQDASSYPEDFARPGHVFPLRSRAGGVLERRGQMEAAVNTSARAVSWIQHISLCSPRWLDRPSLA